MRTVWVIAACAVAGAAVAVAHGLVPHQESSHPAPVSGAMPDSMKPRHGLAALISEVAVAGPLTAAQVSQELESRWSSMQGCFDGELQRRGNVNRRLEVRFTTNPGGGVHSVDIRGAGSDDNRRLESCMVSAIRVWLLPAASSGPTTVSFWVDLRTATR